MAFMSFVLVKSEKWRRLNFFIVVKADRLRRRLRNLYYSAVSPVYLVSSWFSLEKNRL